VFSQSDVILIGYFMGNADIGVYRVALQFTTIATFSSYALRTTLWPKVSRWAKNNEMNVVEISLSNALTYSLILAIPAFVGGVLLGKDLLSNFYGTDFADGYSVLIILLGVQVITIFQYFFTMYLDALDMPKESFKVTSIAVFVNIMLNVFLIPVYGINGAAIATFVTMAGNSILSYMILSKHINIKLQLECLMHMVMASFIMSIVIFIFIAFVPITNIITSLLAVFVGGVVYVYSILKMDRQIQKEFENIVRYFG
jgi:O-antigen/teichoic acid export membrane protein